MPPTTKIRVEEFISTGPQGTGSATFAFAKSKTYEKLKEEVFRYMIRRTGGSVLISGHRGAGKTTLVQNVIRDLRKAADDRQDNLRPLFVPLHGPDLLDVSRSANRMNTDASVVAKKDSDSSQVATGEVQLSPNNLLIKNVLENLTIALYRSLADEFYEAFEKKVKEQGRLRELKELVGLLRLELDDSSDTAALKEIWSKAGFLETGVLFDGGAENRGIQEIVTLTTAAQAYRIVTGVLTDSQESKKDATRESTYATEASALSKDIISAGAALISGLAVGIGVFKSVGAEYKMLFSGLSGLFTALVANFSFKLSFKSTEKAQQSKQYKFIRNRDISSLNRELPNLINRIRQLGLSPVFVVDELDKVLVAPFDKFGDLINYLKKLVSDNSFFCFLTDRNYYDFIINLNNTNKYPKEYTYFTHRLYVNYAPNDLHGYMDDLFQPRLLADETEKVDAILMQYMLLNRSNSHTIDLRREMIKRSDNGFISADGIRSRMSYRFPIMIQLAIESIIDGDDLAERIEQDAYFSQLITDTLYYPVKHWWSGERYIDTSRSTLIKYIIDKADFQFDNPEVLATLIENEDWVELEKIITVSMTDIEILYAKLNELMDMLADFNTLLASIKKQDKAINIDTRYNGAGLWTTILDVIPPPGMDFGGSSMILLQKVGANKFKWQCDYFGHPLENVLFEIEAVMKKATFIKEMQVLVKNLTNDEVGLDELARVQVINTSPEYYYVEQAIQRLDNFVNNKMDYPDRVPDMQNVQEFHTLLIQKGTLIAQVLVLAKFLTRYDNKNAKKWIPVLASMQFLLDVKFGDSPEKLLNMLNQLPIEKEEFEQMATEPVTIQKWRDKFGRLLKKEVSYGKGFEQVKVDWLKLWRQRMLENLTENTIYFDVTMDELICDVAGHSFAQSMSPDLSKITRKTWSDLALEASTQAFKTPLVIKGNVPPPPAWMMLPALNKLGFYPKFIEHFDSPEQEDFVRALSNSFVAIPQGDCVIVITNQPAYQSQLYYTEFLELRKPALIFEYENWTKNFDAIKVLLDKVVFAANMRLLVVGEFGIGDDADGVLNNVLTSFNSMKTLPVPVAGAFRLVPYTNQEIKSMHRIIRRLSEVNLFDAPK